MFYYRSSGNLYNGSQADASVLVPGFQPGDTVTSKVAQVTLPPLRFDTTEQMVYTYQGPFNSTIRPRVVDRGALHDAGRDLEIGGRLCPCPELPAG